MAVSRASERAMVSTRSSRAPWCWGVGGRRQSSESPVDQSQLARGLLPAWKGSGGECWWEGPQGSMQVEGPSVGPSELALIMANTDISGRPASAWLVRKTVDLGTFHLARMLGHFSDPPPPPKI